jgi:hypothetical protein
MNTLVPILLILFLIFISVSGYLLYEKWDKARKERKRIKDWEDKVNGKEIFFFADCDYKSRILTENPIIITKPMSSRYTFDKPIKSMILPSGAKVKGYKDDTYSVSITHGGPKVMRCIPDSHEPFRYVIISDI